MPLAANPTSTSSTMPTGGAGGSMPDTELASSVTPNANSTGGQQSSTGGSTQWMPVFQIGTGNPGMPTDARGLISGNGAGTTQVAASGATATAASTATQAALAANTPATSSGSSTGSSGPSGGAASSVPDDSSSGGGGGDSSGGYTPVPGSAATGSSPYNNLPEADS